MKITDLIPAGCSVETCGTVATVHDTKGGVIAIVCAEKHNVEIARLIAAFPALMDAMDSAMDRGMLLPILYGMRALDRAVFQLRPAA
jgi:hypothetical protein